MLEYEELEDPKEDYYYFIVEGFDGTQSPMRMPESFYNEFKDKFSEMFKRIKMLPENIYRELLNKHGLFE